MRTSKLAVVFVLSFCISMFTWLATIVASEMPIPFSKQFLKNPQEFVSLIGVDPDNPSERIELLAEVLQARSMGGNTVFWSILRDAPAAISTKIPVPNGSSDVLLLLDELKDVFDLTDVFQELEVRFETFDIPSDSGGNLPSTNYLILQHVCRFTDGTQVDVSGSRFYATIDLEGNLITLSSTYTALDCIYPSGLLHEEEIRQLYPGVISTITRELLPPNAINGIPGGTYLYSFSTANTYYEVRADNGTIVNSYSLKSFSHGLTRKVKDVTSVPETIKCEDTQPSLPSNSSGGSSCVDPFSHMYNSLFFSVLPWNGTRFLSQLLGKPVKWGFGNKSTIDVDYDTNIGTTVDALGFYQNNQSNGGFIHLNRWSDVSGVGLLSTQAKTRTVDSQNQSLPGLGGAIDLVSHEVGHGYIAAFLKVRDESDLGKFKGGAGAYKVGEAITESLADMFGKISEGYARYSMSNCSSTISTPPVPNCGQNSSLPCGNSACKNGEYCDQQYNKCKPCHTDCPAQNPAIINWEFATKYPDGENIFTVNDVYGRKMWKESLWSIGCHWGTSNTDNIQVYGNSMWLSGLLSSYSTTEDPLFNSQRGFIRNIYDLSALESILRHV